MNEQKPKVSVVIVTLNGRRVIGDCLRSLEAGDCEAMETIVVNNGSVDGTGELVRESFGWARVIDLPENRGFAGGNNVGIETARGKAVVLLNDDTIVRPETIRELTRPIFEEPDVGIVGAKIFYPGETHLQHAGAEILPNGMTRHYGYEEEDRGQWDERREVDYVSGCAMAIGRRVIDDIGPFDEGYFPIYYEETEYCVRARRAGWRVIYEPRAVLTHLESQTQERFSPRFIYRMTKNRGRFVLKNFTARQMAGAVKYEALWLWRSAPKDFWAPMLRGYAATAAGLPATLRARRAAAAGGKRRAATGEATAAGGKGVMAGSGAEQTLGVGGGENAGANRTNGREGAES